MEKTQTGRAYFIGEVDAVPDLPEGQTWKIMKLGMGIFTDSSPEGIKHLEDKVLIPPFYLCATDKKSAQEAIAEKVGALFDAYEQEKELENIEKHA